MGFWGMWIIYFAITLMSTQVQSHSNRLRQIELTNHLLYLKPFNDVKTDDWC